MYFPEPGKTFSTLFSHTTLPLEIVTSTFPWTDWINTIYIYIYYYLFNWDVQLVHGELFYFFGEGGVEGQTFPVLP